MYAASTSHSTIISILDTQDLAKQQIICNVRMIGHLLG